MGQDAEERCYADSFTEIPEHDDVNGTKVQTVMHAKSVCNFKKE